MRLEALFHFSFYCTLALAAACLTLPSTFFLGWMPFFLAAAFGFFFLAWRYEGAWELSETAANQIGIFIAIGAAVWILFQVPRSVEQLANGGVNWPAGLLPHLGPLLVILLIVKLFRPKRLPDYWVIQTMGLMMVALAAVLADDRLFGLFMVLYFASLVWSLVLYYPVREQALVRAAAAPQLVPLFAGVAAGARAPLPWRFWGGPRVVLWTGTVAVLGFLLFLCAPRQGQSQWHAHQLSSAPGQSAKTGSEAGIDLNRVGTIELSDEPAFAVTVRDHQGKLQDPAHIKRWRQETLEVYSKGRWYPQRRTKETNTQTLPSQAALPEPTALAENQWRITFHVKPSVAGGLVLAEPINLELGVGLGPRVDDKAQPFSFFSFPDGWDTFVPNAYSGLRKTYVYSQVMQARGDQVLTPARNVKEGYFAEALAKYPVPLALAAWTRTLLQRLPELSDAERQLNNRQRLDDSAHAKVAQALCRHLALSGEYRYSLDLRRQDNALDPTVDFLINIKEGHCERYAGGLALMLRSLGVRCRVVKGYLGAEMDDDGHGVVRLSQAHSWVQALIPGELPGAKQWLTLDPTPAATAPDGVLVSWWNWCKDNLLDTRIFWRQFIMEYTPEQQLDMLSSLQRVFTTKRGWLTLLLLTGAATVLVVGPRMGRRLCGAARRWFMAPGLPAKARVPFFDDFLRLLRRQGNLAPQPGQTPREFATRVAALLSVRPDAGDAAGVPQRVVDAYYEVRFGGRQLDSVQRIEIAQWLAKLRTRLRQTAS